MWIVENTHDAPMVVIAAFRHEQTAREFATMIGDGSIVEHRELIEIGVAEDIASHAAQLMLEDIESTLKMAIEREAAGSDAQVALEEVLDGIGNHDANDVATAALAKRAA